MNKKVIYARFRHPALNKGNKGSSLVDKNKLIEMLKNLTEEQQRLIKSRLIKILSANQQETECKYFLARALLALAFLKV